MPIGPHVNRTHAKGRRPNITAHIRVAVQEAKNAGIVMGVTSIFVGGPKNRKITLKVEERKELADYVTHTSLRIIAHSSYSASPWRGSVGAAEYIKEEQAVCQSAGITGLVVHLPKLPIAEVMRYVGGIVNDDAPDVRIYFETPAVNPRASYYETPQKLADLFDTLRVELDPDLNKFGLCVDTAHLWTCGVDLQSYAVAEMWFANLESMSNIIPHDRVMIHLNDSIRELGTGPDTHTKLMHGKIWGDFIDTPTESGLAAVTDYIQRHDTVAILERKPMSAILDDYVILRKLVPSIVV